MERKAGLMKLEKEDVLYEDKAIIVCHKRAGVATQTARLGEPDMESVLKNYLRTPYLAVVHRLDQPVEGILVFARTKEAAAALGRQNAGWGMHKKYYAIACVDVPLSVGKEGILVDYLQRNGRENISRVVGKNAKDSKCAQLTYRMLFPGKEIKPGKEIVLAQVELKTGRHHQIRVQMAHAGMPLLGDYKYGTEESKAYGRERHIKNVALCAYCLEFSHPVTGRRMAFEIKPSGEVFLPFFPVNS